MSTTQYKEIAGVNSEQIYTDVDSVGEEYKEIPISFDTTFFGTVLDDSNTVIHSNRESTAGCSYAPFIKCRDAEQLMKRMTNLVQKLSSRIKASIGAEPAPFVRIFVYRFVDASGVRSFAVGATNGRPKHPIFHSLGIKTIRTEPQQPIAYDLWEAVAEEMSLNPKEVGLCEIEKNEVMQFERRKVPIPDSSKNVLIMLPASEGFNASHYTAPTRNSYHGTMSKAGDVVPPGSFFEINSVRFSSMRELDLSIKWMVESYRSITGSAKVKAIALYTVVAGEALDAGIICYTPASEKSEFPDDEALL